MRLHEPGELADRGDPGRGPGEEAQRSSHPLVVEEASDGQHVERPGGAPEVSESGLRIEAFPALDRVEGQTGAHLAEENAPRLVGGGPQPVELGREDPTAWLADAHELASRAGTVNEHRAVSYTHLRAHETDSYLVCRLLLATKNK